MRWAGYVACMRAMRSAYNIFVRKSEGKRPLRRSKNRGEDNVRIDLREIVWKDVDWMLLAENRDQWWALVKMVMNLRVP
jgi:hypothetical protein